MNQPFEPASSNVTVTEIGRSLNPPGVNKMPFDTNRRPPVLTPGP